MENIWQLLEPFNKVFFQNSLLRWLGTLVAIGCLYYLFRLLRWVVTKQFLKLAKKTSIQMDDYLVNIIRQTKDWFLLVLSVYFASWMLIRTSQVKEILNAMITVALLVQAGFWGAKAVTYIVQHKVDEKDAKTLEKIIKMAIWIIILILALDNIPGLSVDTLITSLGITGIVVGLAVQGILEDLFSSFLITVDRPVEEGDYIVLDDYMGTIEKVGWKSTRIRSLSGELIITSNSDILNSRIRNYRGMPQRRVSLKFGVTYQTTPQQLRQTSEIVRKIIENKPQLTFDLARMTGFSSSSIDFEAAYYVNEYNYSLYLELQEAVNLELLEQLAEQGIEFAYPTQTIFLEKKEEAAR